MGIDKSSDASQREGSAEILVKGRVVEFNEKFAAETRNINIALIPDPNGNVKRTKPTGMDPEKHRMNYENILYRAIEVPPEDVLIFMGSPVKDLHNTHSATVNIQNKRTVVVFDRTYVFGGRTIQQCAWVPDRKIRAGILFTKRIDRQTRRPLAVLRRMADGATPMYQIVGAKEPEYRDLRRVFERVFIKGGRPGEMDDELDKFMHESIGPIPEEEAK
jgi:hypothetical protein